MRAVRKPGPSRVTGAGLVLAGIGANKWLLGDLLAPDGKIEGWFLTSTILTIQAFLILTGLVIFSRGRDESVRRGLINALLLGASTILCLAGAELLLRVYPPSIIPEDVNADLFLKSSGDRERDKLRPNVEIRTRKGPIEAVIRTNSHGMHWPEVSLHKHESKTRIAFVGDSFAFGMWADKVRNSFVGIYDSLLDSERYEVLNFGVPGYGLVEIEQQLREEVLAFRPDFVFLVIFNGNDFGETYLSTYRDREYDDLIPPMYRQGRGRYAHLLEQLSLYKLIVGGFSKLNYTAELREITERAGPNGDSWDTSRFRSYTFWSQRKYPEIAIQAVKVTLDRVERISRLCERHGIRLVIVALPFAQQVYAEHPIGDEYDITLPQAHIANFAEELGIPYLDLLPPLRAYTQGSGKRIYWDHDAHFNNEGHRITGELLAKQFSTLTEWKLEKTGTPRSSIIFQVQGDRQ